MSDGFIFYKFAHTGIQEKIPCSEAEISIGDLKTIIGEKKRLPRWDLVISDELTGLEYKKDGEFVLRNSKILVKRTPLLAKKKGVLSASTLREDPAHHKDLSTSPIPIVQPATSPGSSVDADDDKEIVRRPFPQEYICTLCTNPFNDPFLRTCCGHSACRDCLKGDGKNCQLCGETDGMNVPNKNLKTSVESLDKRWYYLPGREYIKMEETFGGSSSSQPDSPEQGTDKIKREQIKEEINLGLTPDTKVKKEFTFISATEIAAASLSASQLQAKRIKEETIIDDEKVQEASAAKRVKKEKVEETFRMLRPAKQENAAASNAAAPKNGASNLTQKQADQLLKAWKEHAWMMHYQKLAEEEKQKEALGSNGVAASKAN